MKKKLLLTVAGLTAAILVGLGVVAARWYADMNREDPHASPAPDSPEAPKWGPKQAADAATEPSDANPGPSPGSVEKPSLPDANPPLKDRPEKNAEPQWAPPIGEVPGITYHPCPAEFARPLEDLGHKIPEVPSRLLCPSPPIDEE
ncbi:MAG TPA: hypothetical protein VMY42_16145 [Thermoguttaceae bacterium]|nr:hypothetical protein [Thermoguttaceae bacterium]